jgi:hypothetical protein
MVEQGMIWAYLLLCLVLASMPWLTNRLFMVKSLAHKSAWLRLIEWFVYAFIALAAGWGLEFQLTGTIQAQTWEFFTSTLFMFAIMAFPGFIWHQQRKNQTAPMIAAE